MDDATSDTAASSPGGAERSLADVAFQQYRAIFDTYVDANKRAFAYGQSLFEIMTRPYVATLEAMARPSDATATAAARAQEIERVFSALEASTPPPAIEDEPTPTIVVRGAVAREAVALDDVIDETVKTFVADATTRASSPKSGPRKRAKKRSR